MSLASFYLRPAFAVVVLAGVSVNAWAEKVGPAFRVNTTTIDDQASPSVATLSNGTSR
jgi:hypothetical protein